MLLPPEAVCLRSCDELVHQLGWRDLEAEGRHVEHSVEMWMHGSQHLECWYREQIDDVSL